MCGLPTAPTSCHPMRSNRSPECLFVFHFISSTFGGFNASSILKLFLSLGSVIIIIAVKFEQLLFCGLLTPLLTPHTNTHTLAEPRKEIQIEMCVIVYPNLDVVLCGCRSRLFQLLLSSPTPNESRSWLWMGECVNVERCVKWSSL